MNQSASPIWKAVTVKAFTSPSQKSEAPPLPVDTSSQASMEDAEASLKGLPAKVSHIAGATAAAVLVHHWNPQNFRLMPT